jgi:hypothetical protein
MTLGTPDRPRTCEHDACTNPPARNTPVWGWICSRCYGYLSVGLDVPPPGQMAPRRAPAPVVKPVEVVYADPPYAGTTGYAHDLPRAEVVRYCLAYAAMGATVCVSEQEPIPDLVAAGWHATEITHDWVGKKRTFSKQQAAQIGLSNLGEVLHA